MHWLLPVALLAFAGVAELAGDPARLALRYARSAVAEGELWRLVSGHLVHLGWSHLTMNGLALVAIWALVGRNLQPRAWLLVVAVCMAGIDAGFWWLDPQLIWYVGMSGILHGLLGAGLIAGWSERRGEALLVGALLAAKLAYEQLLGPLPGSAATAGGAVVVNAHLYGAVAGCLAMLVLRVRLGTARPI